MNIKGLLMRSRAVIFVLFLFSCQTIFGIDQFHVPPSYRYLLNITETMSCTQALLNRNYSVLTRDFPANHPFWKYLKWNQALRFESPNNYILENSDKSVLETINHYKSLKTKFFNGILSSLEEAKLSPVVQQYMLEAAEKLSEEFLFEHKDYYSHTRNHEFMFSQGTQRDFVGLIKGLELEVARLKGIVGELLVMSTISQPIAVGEKVRDFLSPRQKEILRLHMKTKSLYKTILDLEIDVVHGNGLRWLEVKNYRSQFRIEEVLRLRRRHQLLMLASEAFVTFGEKPIIFEYVFLNRGTTPQLVNELTRMGAHVYLPE